MKVVILAGGFGTRISEESHLKPKPMIEIGGMPILWHVMKIYSYYGYNEFIICAGYKQHIIKEYFADYYLHRSDVTFDFTDENKMVVHSNIAEPWKVTVIDTGLNTMTGGRVKRIEKYINGENFLLTYGDGVSDINISELVDYFNEKNTIAAITAINVRQRFGVLEINKSGKITRFKEKSDDDGNLINGGFMVLKPDIFDYIESDDTVLERKPLETLVERGEISAFKHDGFWQCMDTQRDREFLENLWMSDKAPWKKW